MCEPPKSNCIVFVIQSHAFTGQASQLDLRIVRVNDKYFYAHTPNEDCARSFLSCLLQHNLGERRQKTVLQVLASKVHKLHYGPSLRDEEENVRATSTNVFQYDLHRSGTPEEYVRGRYAIHSPSSVWKEPSSGMIYYAVSHLSSTLIVVKYHVLPVPPWL